ncbi:NAD(P)H-dependent oxidoreductase [Phyllobacterium sp. 21LDTY02-6]|jgi:NAD(P)H-dependent FMN reductase|uniref:NADPH-dependent FMN reductase n=1 Tax=unclassified Phyllobacterium TaxID=2638441 RepID=UPI0020227C76|nr:MULTISPECIES: NAD(P)H-dependent oxidoreductase [unclassified Phyllobacterium]MCO4318677.1 NAD(P)H-dependent oxidoreductase [Phyllobacterium sp. 21LDTY02-6]MCX8281192.1 NAD(P)H-dependent oxidoreductase [Phyllobacterium sp. 0TCS1.6C]MCX8294521.1 NAD(P)H-dependent oxidoreductase [Phyllobacterium sp. 0TCS1.6A]
MAKLKIGIIVGSTRMGRFAEYPAKWASELAAGRSDVETEIVDLLDYPMHFFGEERSTTAETETAERWKKKLRTFDAYIITVAEYNHAPTAVLKNAIDLGDFIHKPVGFVGYGGVGGARAVEHLRGIFVEMSAASVKAGVHISYPEYLTVVKGEKKLGDYPHLNEALTAQIDQLAWWGNALKAAREKA